MAVRSISLPSRLHPTSTSLIEVECSLNSLNSLKALELEPPSISSLRARLVALAELYISLTDLIQTPSTQQSLSRYDQGRRLVHEALDCSVALISTCSVARDLVSSLKGHVRGLQSALRRRSGVDSHAAAYVAFRKRTKKEAAECIRELNQVESASNNEFGPLLDESDFYLVLVVRLFREVVSVTIRTLRSLLSLLSTNSKSSGSAKWALLARLVAKRARRSSISSEKDKDGALGEAASVDVVICSMQSRKEGVDTEAVQRRLRGLDCGSEDLEGAMERLYRRLVQNRVSLLNILTY